MSGSIDPSASGVCGLMGSFLLSSYKPFLLGPVGLSDRLPERRELHHWHLGPGQGLGGCSQSAPLVSHLLADCEVTALRTMSTSRATVDPTIALTLSLTT